MRVEEKKDRNDFIKIFPMLIVYPRFGPGGNQVQGSRFKGFESGI
jgi:hypothetical protein